MLMYAVALQLLKAPLVSWRTKIRCVFAAVFRRESTERAGVHFNHGPSIDV